MEEEKQKELARLAERCKLVASGPGWLLLLACRLSPALVFSSELQGSAWTACSTLLTTTCSGSRGSTYVILTYEQTMNMLFQYTGNNNGSR
jgi:hypothetical protein